MSLEEIAEALGDEVVPEPERHETEHHEAVNLRLQVLGLNTVSEKAGHTLSEKAGHIECKGAVATQHQQTIVFD